MKNIFAILITFWVVFYPSVIRSEIIQSSHLQISEGLQQSTIYSIYQDEFGILWFGTKNGLVRFDGNKTEYIDKIYQDIPLSESLIRYVCGNNAGKIYLSTRSEVIEYDIRRNTFSEVLDKPATIHYGMNTLWICQKNAISQWANDSLKTYITLPKEDVTIDCLVETPENELFLGTKDHGIFMIERNGKIHNYFPQFSQVKQLLFDSQQNLWIATRRGGLYKMDRQKNLISYKSEPENPHSLSNNIVRAICEDNQKNLWVATFGGLNKYIRNEDKFVQCDFLNENFYSLNDNSIYCLFKDQQGTIWTGSYMGEVNYFDPNYETFRYHTVNISEAHQHRNIVFGKIVEDNAHNLWIAAERNGLFYYDIQKDKLASYLTKEELNIQTIYLDQKNNTLWLGTLLQGLTRINLNNNTSQSYKLKNNSIREIIPYKGRLLLGTLSGIFLFDPLTETAETLESHTHALDDRAIICMMLDSRECLWIAYDNRLMKYSLPTDECEVITLHSNSYNNVTKIIESSKGDIWIGTKRHGLYLSKEGKGEPVRYHNSNGMASNLVVDIAEDKKGNILVITGNGLSYFVKDHNQIINIQREKFIPGFALSENCLFTNSTNKVYIGGVNVLCEFSTESLFTFSKNYMVNFSQITINGEKMEVSTDNQILRESLLYCQRLVLPYSSNSFNIEVFTNNYTMVARSGISYKLEGLDKEWKEANTLNEITYTSLPPGKYTLHVKGDTPLSNGQYPERKLEIRVKAPFYQSTFAYILYGLLVIGILYAIYQFSMLRSSLRFEKEQKKYIEELNQSKLRFFTNISHEFKTPLTLIFNHVETLLSSKSLSPRVHGKLLSIWKNTNRMNQLITELMEFRKQEQGFLKLKVSHNDIIGLVKEIVLSFKDYAQSRKITLGVDAAVDNINFYFDATQIEKAIQNLLSNAFKFTPDGGNILIRIEKENDRVLIHVSDTGIGISSEDQKKIFDRFYQTEDVNYTNRYGTGIGLAFARNIVEAHQGNISVISNKGKGSTFTLSLPSNISYKPEEIETNTVLLKDSPGEINHLPDEHFFEEIREQQEKAETGSCTILIIEDNEEVRELLHQMFSPLYEVILAVNGKDGYEKAIACSPDIIVSDIVMPEMSGVELCKKLKTNMETSHIPIILLTSQAAPEYVIEGLKTGADDYITKPFSSKQLIVRCNNLVNNRKMLQKRFAREIDKNSIELIATTSIDQSVIDNSIRIIHENLENPLFSIDFIAQKLGIGRTKYFTKIKAITGLTPNEFVINTKLKYAVRVIKENNTISTTELSESLGFSSTSYFIRLFKEFTGMTPQQFKGKAESMEPSK